MNNQSILDEETHFIKPNEDMHTKVPGVFSAGDINTKHYRQIATAINDGGVAALAAVEYINHQKWN